MKRDCPGCGAKTKTEVTELSAGGQCDSCKMFMVPMAEPMELQRSDLEQLIRRADVPVILEFFTAWSPDSKALAPSILKAAERLASKCLIVRINAEESPDLATQLGFNNVPAFAVFKRTKLLHVHQGVVEHRILDEWVRAAGKS